MRKNEWPEGRSDQETDSNLKTQTLYTVRPPIPMTGGLTERGESTLARLSIKGHDIILSTESQHDTEP